MDVAERKDSRPVKQNSGKIDRTWDISDDKDSDTEDETILGTTPKENTILRRPPSPSIPIYPKSASPKPNTIKAITLRICLPPKNLSVVNEGAKSTKQKDAAVKISVNDYISVHPASIGSHQVTVYNTHREDSPSPPASLPSPPTSRPSETLSERFLLILDMNGVLMDREYRPLARGVKETREEREGGFRIGPHLVWKRPFLHQFLDYCFENFNVVVWTTVTAKNGQPLVDFVFGPRVEELRGIFYQEYCELAPPPDVIGGNIEGAESKKPLFLKNLSTIWECNPQFSAANTLIVDDSPEKLVNNPARCCINPTSWKRTLVNDDELGRFGRVRTFLSDVLVTARK